MSRSSSRITGRALLFRTFHAAISVCFLSAIGYVWWCALTGRRGILLTIAIGSLVTEGTVVALNKGDCPLGGLQERIGDPVPLFELVLPRGMARLAVPGLGIVAAGGMVLVATRPSAGASDPESTGPGMSCA